jgi:hypothetical protein
MANTVLTRTAITNDSVRRKPAKQKIERVMHEFAEGELESSSGDKVTNRKQAVAIALSEARRAGKKKK